MPELSRRTVFRAGVASAGVLASGCAAGGRPAAADTAPTFVIVHGANGNGASYAPLVSALAQKGNRALAVDLPGHGPGAHFPMSYQAPQDVEALVAEPSPLAQVRLEDNVAHVVNIVRSVAAYGPVILLGHSMGGATITRVGNEIPDHISRLVYLTAFCCVQLRSVLDCFTVPEAASTLATTIPSLGDPERTGVTRTNWRSAEPAFVAAAKAALADDYDDDSFRVALNGMEPDESWQVAVTDARGAPATWGRIPRSYIRCSLDRMLPPALQDRMIAEADAATPGNAFDVHTLAATHLGPQDPGPLVDILISLAHRLPHTS